MEQGDNGDAILEPRILGSNNEWLPMETKNDKKAQEVQQVSHNPVEDRTVVLNEKEPGSSSDAADLFQRRSPRTT